MAELPELTEKQLRFAHEFANDPNATQAYLRAFGGAYNTARTEGPRLLANPAIEAEIDSARKAWAKRCQVSFTKTVRALAAIAFADPADLYEADPDNCGMPKPRPWNAIPPAARKNIKSVKFKRRKLKGGDECLYEIEELEYKVADKEWALGKLCEYLGITKNSLTADELRAIIFGNAAQPGSTQATPELGAAETPPDGADTPSVIHRDE